PELAPLLNKLRQARAGLARLASHPPTAAGQRQWLERFRALEQDKDDLQARMARLSLRFRRQRHLSPALVAGALPAGAALVDFLEYTHVPPRKGTKGAWDTERRLLAFVVRPGRAPVCVPLGAVAPVARAVQAWRKPFLTATGGAVDRDAAAELRKRLWLPLQ